MAELSKSTVLSGTGDLTGLGIVYVYNTNIFSDDLITSGLYYDSRKINPEIIEILANPERKNIRNIYKYISNLCYSDGTKVYKPVHITNESGTINFTVPTQKTTKIGRQGFNIIVYCEKGYTKLSESLGKVIDGNYGVDRFYFTKGVNMIINYSVKTSNEHNEVENKDILGTSLDIGENRNFLGPKLYNYASISEAKGSEYYLRKTPFYTNNIDTLRNSKRTKTIFLDNSFYNIDNFNLSLRMSGSLGICRNISCSTNISCTNFQVGYFSGQGLVLYSWGNNIFEIRTLSDGEIILSGTFENYSKENVIINYFSGSYIACSLELSGDQILFDLSSKTGKDISIEESDHGWIKNLTNRFLVDQRDITGKVYILPETNPRTYTSRRLAEQYFPGISSINLDLETFLSSNTIEVKEKLGSWYVISCDNKGRSYTYYTNLDKTIQFDENTTAKPIVVNDNVLLVSDIISSGGTKYTIYEKSGKYVYGDDDTESIIFPTVAEPITYIAESFFSRYRRNILPDTDTLNGFSIVTAFGGLIFYKFGSYINYL